MAISARSVAFSARLATFFGCLRTAFFETSDASFASSASSRIFFAGFVGSFFAVFLACLAAAAASSIASSAVRSAFRGLGHVSTLLGTGAIRPGQGAGGSFTFRSPPQPIPGKSRLFTFRASPAPGSSPLTSEGSTVKLSRIAQVGAVGAIAALALAGCASNEDTADPVRRAPAPALSGTLTGAGASSQEVAVQAWIAGFQTANPDVTVNYDPHGSGAGRESFQSRRRRLRRLRPRVQGRGDRGRPVRRLRRGPDIVELPTYISPIAIAFNLEGVDELNLDAATIAGIFAGTITNWNDPAIAAPNDGRRRSPTSPSRPCTAPTTRARPRTSPTTSPRPRPTCGPTSSAGSGRSRAARPPRAPRVSSTPIEGGNGTIGYADASQAGELGAVSVQVGDEFVEPSAEAAAIVVDASPFEEGRADGDLAIALDRTTDEAGVYPIVLVSYLIACEEYAGRRPGRTSSRASCTTAISEAGQEAAADGRGQRADLGDARRAGRRPRSTRSSSPLARRPRTGRERPVRGRGPDRIRFT